MLERAPDVGGERTQKAAMTPALEEFNARRTQRRLLERMNSLEWDTRFDYQAERERR